MWFTFSSFLQTFSERVPLFINADGKLGNTVLSLTPAFRPVLTEAARKKPF